MSTRPPTCITVEVYTDAPEIVARALNAFTTAAAGLALEGATVHVWAGPDEADSDEELADEDATE